MRPKTAKMPAMIPTTAPVSSFVPFSIDLGLGELDLLTDEERRRLGDLLDRLAEL